MELDYQNKVIMDIALNMGMLMAEGKVPNYGNFDYYEVLIQLTDEFLALPAPEFDPNLAGTFYVVRIDDFANRRLKEMFG